MNITEGKTIAAISTAYGEGGIGIVRLSGELSKTIIDKIFKPFKKSGGKFILKNRYLHYGYITDDDKSKIIDEVLIAFMEEPSTYTKEDICEIYCHGSIISLRKILELVLKSGAVPAEPGEFTKRAFLNGRIDLAQAEAVIEVVKAKSDLGFDLAVDQMEGSVSKKINELREKILNVIASIIVDIDYPDEDEEAVHNLNIKDNLKDIKTDIDDLIKTADAGRMIKEGIDTVIVGKPNVGKSSLMNELLKETRAIVTEIPGTTRDTIEEGINIDGIPIKITDTAGIRQTKDKIEQIGIQKTKEAFNKADLIIFMLDGKSGIDESDKEISEKIGDRKCFAVINKTDLGNIIKREEILSLVPHAEIIEMSLKDGKGRDILERGITDMVFSGNLKQGQSLVVTSVRHKDLMKKASEELGQAMNMIDAREALDFVHVNVNQAYEYLGEITGQTVTDDIMDRVFSEFCVGK